MERFVLESTNTICVNKIRKNFGYNLDAHVLCSAQLTPTKNVVLCSAQLTSNRNVSCETFFKNLFKEISLVRTKRSMRLSIV